MKNNNLVENLYGHGGISHSKLRHVWKRLWRPTLGKSEQPYNWNNPVPDPNYPIKNQGTNFSCGRQAGSYLQRVLLKNIGMEQGEISAKSGYGRYCAYGGGMTVDAIETDICSYGANLEASVPSYTPQGEPLSESMMEEKSYETVVTLQDAMTRAGFTPVNVNIDKDSMAEAIRDYGGIIMLLKGQNGNQPNNWTTNIPSPPVKTNKNPLWEHWMACLFTDTIRIGAYQSWGDKIGQNGKQFFDEEYINSGYIIDCIAFLSDKQIISLPATLSPWSQLLVWFHSLFAV